MIKRLKAFSLIEISIVILILGLILSFTLPVLSTARLALQQAKTEHNQQQIFYALAAYVLKFNHLPCPSQLNEEISGKMRFPCHDNFTGILPFYDLGLPAATAKDGYGNWFTYAVNPELTSHYLRPQGDKLAESSFCSVAHSPLQLKLSPHTSEEVVKISKQDHLAVILVSHGQNGLGALGNYAAALTTSEHENSNGDRNFILEDEEGGSHKVYWVTRNNLMAIFGHSPCQQGVNETNLSSKETQSQQKKSLW